MASGPKILRAFRAITLHFCPLFSKILATPLTYLDIIKVLHKQGCIIMVYKFQELAQEHAMRYVYEYNIMESVDSISRDGLDAP